jgi:uncharacterized pyridoxamine 5'-phosphate oxidase family protein
MDEILAYMKNSGAFYVATNEGDQPRVRPFGAVCVFEGKMYICTNNKKPVYAQMLKNPKIEISCMGKGDWLRLEAEAVPDHRREARVAMLEDSKSSLSRLYSPDDGIFEVLYLKNATATISAMGQEPKMFKY